MIDKQKIEEIKQNLSISDVVSASGLTLVQRGNKFSTQEHDSLILFPSTNSWTWYNQAGKGGKHLGGSVIDWLVHHERLSFVDAYAKAAAMLGNVPAATVSKPKPQAKRQAEPPKDYRQQAVAACKRLDTAAGDAVALYLDGRGIDYISAKAWGLGAADWYGKEAIAMPHSDGKAVTVKLRLLPPVEAGDKCRWLGSPNAIFGEHVLKGDKSSRVLFACEGELNAVSVWIAARQMGVDAVSFGNKKVPVHLQERLVKLAQGYRLVIVWTDESADTQAIMAALPGAVGVRSLMQDGDGAKLDANEMLQRGWLTGYVTALLNKHAPAAPAAGKQPLPRRLWRERLTFADAWAYQQEQADYASGLARHSDQAGYYVADPDVNL